VATEWIDVIDTAVKIGLGALISGWATNKANKLKHQSEREKDTVAVKREMILIAVEKMDEYMQFLSSYYSRLDGLRQSHEQQRFSDEQWLSAWDFIRESENELSEARQCTCIAQSRLQLLCMDDSLKAINNIRSLEKELRTFFIERSHKNKLPTPDYLKNWACKFVKYQNEFQNSTSSVFSTV
jgi:hypothetical protein